MLFIAGRSLIVVRCVFIVACCLLRFCLIVVVRCLLDVVCSLLFWLFVGCLLLAGLVVVCWLLIGVRCSAFVVGC